MTKIYLAGPLFTLAEQSFNVELARFLESEGFEVFLPQEHEPRSKTAKSIFDMDVAALDWADMVVACMDGPDPDSGTAWECGYAYARASRSSATGPTSVFPATPRAHSIISC